MKFDSMFKLLNFVFTLSISARAFEGKKASLNSQILLQYIIAHSDDLFHWLAQQELTSHKCMVQLCKFSLTETEVSLQPGIIYILLLNSI